MTTAETAACLCGSAGFSGNLGSWGRGGEVEFNLQGLNSTPPLEPRAKISRKVLWESWFLVPGEGLNSTPGG